MTMLLFLPAGETGYRWMRVVDARVVAEGEGLPQGDDPVVAVAPAEDVTLHWAELPTRSPAQAVAAARLLVADASAAPLAELHVAVGDEGSADRPIGVVGAAVMRDWLAMLAADGIDPVAVVPAPMLLPRPAEGYARADIAGIATVRGTSSGFADDAHLTPLITGGVEPVTLDRDAVSAGLVAAATAPALDLRQGSFARRRRFALDWRLIRRLAVLALLILGVTLAISLVRIAKYSFGATALEAQADAIARTGLPRGETVTDAARQLDERLSRVRGPGLGFSATAAAVFAAVRATPGTEVTALDFQANGDLRLSVAVEREALATDLKRAIEAAGFSVRAGTFQAAAGRVTGDLTVTAR
ncbi:general secretion pathway protein GspL [Sphingomonas ginsenosidivorax]|uniref:General secretion pathway protein GspL n=1 Tax=Sphingomonas ginsenosidivorax TaxID=862135 RepID=A0A5C6UBP1_9SPHN|nr:type II secretion system protein GspL [Sphingomonas ginsenosidivorax]TXC70132.1 general secretion pathway protein GspL [Sphingomonas ginsenosidivorax]